MCCDIFLVFVEEGKRSRRRCWTEFFVDVVFKFSVRFHKMVVLLLNFFISKDG